MGCCGGAVRFQLLPDGPLSLNVNWGLSRVRRRIECDAGEVYCYIVRSIRNDGGVLRRARGCCGG
jgi:hypothetical protein